MDNKCIKVGIVNYLNVQPLLYGLQKLHNHKTINLQHFHPAQVAQELLTGKIDIGLVPVAIIPQLPNARIIGNHCIASNEHVASVCLLSHVPIQQIENVILDYQSRTSVQLVQLLLAKYWQKKVNYLPAAEHFISEIKGNTAAVIIGDRALENLQNFPYVYDLAQAWHALTGLPFVFAAWVSTQEFNPDFIEKFEQSNAEGLVHIANIAKGISFPAYDLHKYFTQNISYTFDEEKRKGLALFLKMLEA